MVHLRQRYDDDHLPMRSDPAHEKRRLELKPSIHVLPDIVELSNELIDIVILIVSIVLLHIMF